MRWIILSSASGAITAYIVTKVICIKFLGELEKIEKKNKNYQVIFLKEFLINLI